MRKQDIFAGKKSGTAPALMKRAVLNRDHFFTTEPDVALL
jgi:hypothetical protein